MEAEDLLEEPYSFGENHSRICYTKAVCKAWKTPEHNVKIHIRRSGKFVEILIPEIQYNTKEKETNKDIITIGLNLSDSDLDKFLGKTRVGRQFMCLGINKEKELQNPSDDQPLCCPCTITLTKNGIIYIAPSDDCFGFSSVRSGHPMGTCSTVLSFMADDSEPEINTPEAKKAAT